MIKWIIQVFCSIKIAFGIINVWPLTPSTKLYLSCWGVLNIWIPFRAQENCGYSGAFESNLSYFWLELACAILDDTSLKRDLTVQCFQSLGNRKIWVHRWACSKETFLGRESKWQIKKLTFLDVHFWLLGIFSVQFHL